MAKIDYVTSGVHVPPPQHQPRAVALHKTYHAVLGLPNWVPLEFLELPMAMGGCSSPSSSYRSLVRRLTTYMQSSYSRNAYMRRAEQSALSSDVPYNWGTTLTRLSIFLLLTIHVLPSLKVHNTLQIKVEPQNLTR